MMAEYSNIDAGNIQAPLIHDAVRGHWLRFTQLQQLVVAHRSEEVLDCLHEVECAVGERGWYAAGFVSYQAASAFDCSMKTASGGELPLLWFGLYAQVAAVQLPVVNLPRQSHDWRADGDDGDYSVKIAAIKQCIASGATYQVNYSYPLRCRFTADPWQFFVQLHRAQQGDYGAYLDLGNHVICCASPELFFARQQDVVTTRPMKGTAPRGADARSDAKLRSGLQNSAKERAENLMIVDMLRNDLGRIARPGSVKVNKLFAVESYPTLWQMTTEVQAQSDCSTVDLFSALFPCASITGAPKVKTMEIIADLEGEARQIYTGSIGFMLPEGRQQFNVAIRTAVVDKQQTRAEYRVGGGIIWDSDPQQEFLETRNKAQVLWHERDNFNLLETMLWEPARGYHLLDEHLQRLKMSAAHFSIPLDIDCLRQELFYQAAARPVQRWRVRCLIDVSGHSRIEFIACPYCPNTMPVRLVLADRAIASDDPMLYHKTDQRQLYESLRDTAVANNGEVDDVLLFNERGEITETTIANVVLYFDGNWVTPPLSCGLLPGTFRQSLLAQGCIREQVITVKDIDEDTLIYMVNSVRGWCWARLV